MEALEQLKSVLCDPEGNVCISGSDGDRKVISDALKALEQQVAALTEQRDRAEQQVKELLWDDPVEPSFGPAFGDLLMYLNHKTPHPTELYQMMSNGAKLWQQMKDQVAALTKERDELEISNAFAHGEWRAVKDQLAAMTKARDAAIHQTKVATQEHFDMEQELAAAIAREAKLRDAAKAVLEVGMGSDFEALNAAFAIPADDSALQEILKQERERVVQMILNGSFLHTEAPVAIWAREVAAAIRGMA